MDHILLNYVHPMGYFTIPSLQGELKIHLWDHHVVCVGGRERGEGGNAHPVHPISVFQPTDLISENLF